MQTFTDSAGDRWTLDLNIRTVRELRRKMNADRETFGGVDFLDFSTLLYSLNDVFFAADLLALICEDEIESKGLDAEKFGERLRGKVLFDAIEALTAEYIDFFPDPTTAAKLRAVVEKNKTARETLAETVAKAASEAIDLEVENAVRELGRLSSAKSDSAEGASPE